MTHSAGVLTICAEVNKRELNKEGIYKIHSYLPLHITVDHRFMDGMSGGKLINKVYNIRYIITLLILIILFYCLVQRLF